jgi:hypothetical protein
MTITSFAIVIDCLEKYCTNIHIRQSQIEAKPQDIKFHELELVELKRQLNEFDLAIKILQGNSIHHYTTTMTIRELSHLMTEAIKAKEYELSERISKAITLITSDKIEDKLKLKAPISNQSSLYDKFIQIIETL